MKSKEMIAPVYKKSSIKNLWGLVIFSMLFILKSQLAPAQALLNANGPGSTYELINSVLAPGYTAVESPDQCPSHPAFGRHIAEVWDATLNRYVFEFYIHVTPDNDRCINFDRQRVEIKTYESSPDSLKGTTGETITNKWKFRLAAGFQPSPNFTHIHQLKAVGGDDEDPIFTLTARAGSTNILQLLYVKDSSSNSTVLSSANLSLFKGVWVEATEVVKVGANGSYSMTIKRVSDSAVILSYATNNIATIRSGNFFIRPKWGIYRSLNNPTYLRDDSIRLASFFIYEGFAPATPTNLAAATLSSSQINLAWSDNSVNETFFKIERSADGISGWSAVGSVAANATVYSDTGLPSNTTFYYRVSAENPAGSNAYSNVDSATTFSILPLHLISFKALLVNNVAKLAWSSGNEKNVKEYAIEHSGSDQVFKTIGSVAAVNTGNNMSSYTYQDNDVVKGENYYRLKMIDRDGSYQYSPVCMLDVDEKIAVNLYPNPAKHFITVNIQGTIESQTTIIVRDAAGKKVMTILPPNNSFIISLKNLKSGLYNLQLITAGKTVSNHPFIITSQ